MSKCVSQPAVAVGSTAGLGGARLQKNAVRRPAGAMSPTAGKRREASCTCKSLALHQGGMMQVPPPPAAVAGRASLQGSSIASSRPFPSSASTQAPRAAVSAAAVADGGKPVSSTSDRDGSNALSLANIRDALIKLEDTIIFAIVERSQFKSNQLAYQSGGIPVPGFCSRGRQYSFLEWLLSETEQTHGKIRRYTSPDELAFFPEDVPPLVLPPMDFPAILAPFSDEINYNPQIMNLYINTIVPAVTQPGDDNNYGSACLLDVTLLQALSKRIHYGKFVAEAKFLAQTEEYTKLILAKDADGIMDLLTDLAQEGRVIDRVRRKAAAFGQDMDGSAEHPVPKVDPDVVASFYKDWLMPLTKDVEVDYLLRRLEWQKE